MKQALLISFSLLGAVSVSTAAKAGNQFSGCCLDPSTEPHQHPHRASRIGHSSASEPDASFMMQEPLDLEGYRDSINTLLLRCGVEFTKISGLIDYCGERTSHPDARAALKLIRSIEPDLLKILTNTLLLQRHNEQARGTDSVLIFDNKWKNQFSSHYHATRGNSFIPDYETIIHKEIFLTRSFSVLDRHLRIETQLKDYKTRMALYLSEEDRKRIDKEIQDYLSAQLITAEDRLRHSVDFRSRRHGDSRPSSRNEPGHRRKPLSAIHSEQDDDPAGEEELRATEEKSRFPKKKVSTVELPELPRSQVTAHQ